MKIIKYGVVLVVLLSCFLYSQPTGLYWVKQFGTGEDERCEGLCIDENKNLYVTGMTRGALAGENSGETDIFTGKIDRNGNIIWIRQTGTPDIDTGWGITTDKNGNVYVVGTTQGNLDGNTNSGSSDIFIIKYDSEGNKQWTKLSGTESSDMAYSVTTDIDGNIYITGFTQGGLDGNINSGASDIFIIKYNSSGEKIWTKQTGTSGMEEGKEIRCDEFGNIYVTGYTMGGLDGNQNYGGFDAFLIKYDGDGNKIWTKQIGTYGVDSAESMAIDTLRNIYIGGYTDGAFPGNTNSGQMDTFIAKFDTSGNLLWVKQHGSTQKDFGWELSIENTGNLYFTGCTLGGLETPSNAGFYDIFLSKYDEEGNRIWTKQLGTSATNYAYGVVVDNEGYYYISGETNGEFTNNQNSGGKDCVIIKYGLLPVLEVSATQMDFKGVEYKKQMSLPLEIRNKGGDVLTGSISGNEPWIYAVPGEFSTRDSITVDIIVDNRVLLKPSGDYTGSFTINSNGGNKTITVTVKATCVIAMPVPYEPENGNLTFSGSGIVPGKTTIKIWTLSGELIKTLTSNDNSEKIYWDGTDEKGKRVIKGIYIYTYESPVEKGIGKFILR